MTSRWLLAGALALAACTDTRQIVLSIDTTVGVPCDIDRIRVVAKGVGTTMFDQSLKGERLPITITLLDDTPNGSFELDISGLKGDVEVMRASGPLQFRGNKAIESVMLSPECTPDAPSCGLSGAMASSALASAASRVACPDVSRYSGSMALDTFVDACKIPGSDKVLTNGETKPVQLTKLKDALSKSGFRFYGQPIRQIWVAKDGYLSFTQGSPDPSGVLKPGPLDRDIKHEGLPPPLQSVMAFWSQLSLRDTGVCYALDGSPGQQQLRVTWSGACLTDSCTTDNLNFTITLEEISQRISLTYGLMTAGNDEGAHGTKATVGLVNDALGCPAEECSLTTSLCKDGVTSCGYSQVFSETRQSPRVPDMQFVPIPDPE